MRILSQKALAEEKKIIKDIKGQCKPESNKLRNEVIEFRIRN